MESLVSILLPCYNAEKYLRYSLDSILNQEYKNLEILCINDGSSDSTLEILNDYKRKDSRIILIHNKVNLGLISSLNNALQLVKGKYFARMDADDYSTPDRISKQIKFIESMPEIDLVSSAYNYFRIDGQKLDYIPPIATSPNALRFLSLFCTPLTHASVLAKSSLIHRALYIYDHAYPYAEDFELFSRLAWNGVKMCTMEESLYWVRLHSDSVSIKYNNIQFQTNLNIVDRNIRNYIQLSIVLDDTLRGLLACRVNSVINFEQLTTAFSILDKAFDAFMHKLDVKEIREIERYFLYHKLNILTQVNKIRFRELGFKNVLFLIKCLFLIDFRQFFIVFKKIINRK
jgi:glycosyltransferase involved in cell wall biosynthesis